MIPANKDEVMNIDPARRTDEVIKAVFQELLGDMQRHEAALRQQHSAKSLHQFRIAVRKTRSLLGRCHQALPANRLSRFRREFSWLGDFTSGPRDLDVFLNQVNRLREQSGIESSQLDPFVDYLVMRRDQHHQRLYESLDSVRYTRLVRDWREFLALPPPRTSTLDYAKRPVKEFADAGIWKCYRRVMKKGKRIKSDSSDGEVHDLRKACKKLRYMMEFFQTLYPKKKITTQIKHLKKLQDKLGKFQDICVQEEILKAFIRPLDHDVWAPVTTRQLMDDLLKEHGKKKKTMHKKIPKVFSAYAGKNYRKQTKKLFKN